MGYPITLFLCIFSLPFVLPESTLHPPEKTTQHETTTIQWHCYNGQFAHATPGHSLQAPCLRFISPSPGAPVGGTGIHPVRIQVDAGATSAGNIELRWMIFVPAIQQGGREERYPVRECRNKITCDIYVLPNAYYHGNPVVMVTGSYERTPWMNTTIHFLLQEQGKEEPLLLPRQPQPYKASQQQVSQQSSHQAPNPSRQNNYEKSAFKNEYGPFNSRDNEQRRVGGAPQNSLKYLATPFSHIHKVRLVRSGRNNPTSPKEVRTLQTFPGRAGQVLKGRISSYNGQQRGETVLQTQNPSRRKRRERLHVQKNAMKPKGQKHLKRRVQLSVRPHTQYMSHQSTVFRPVRGIPLQSKQSSRHMPKRRFNRQVKTGQAFGYQSLYQQSHPTVKRYAVSGTPQGYGQLWSTEVKSHQAEYPMQYPPPSLDDNYQQRIQSEVNALQRLQTSWHHKEEHDHQMQEQKKKHKQKKVHKSRLLEKLHDLRTDHLTRLSHLSPGVRQTQERLSPTPWRKTLVDTPTRKPQRVVPNYYPIIPHRQVQQESGTTSPNAYQSSQETTTMAPTKSATTTEYVTPTAAPTTEASINQNPTTATKSPVRGRPLSNRERMRNDRMMYQSLQSRYQAEASNKSPSGANHDSRRESSTSGRASYTYREERPLPVASEFETDPGSEGALSTTENDEGHSDYKNRDTVSRENLPDSPDDIDESTIRKSWAQYSDLLPAYYDETEEEFGGNTFNDAVGMADEDGPDQIYDTSVSMDTWGESKSVRSRSTDRSTADDTNGRMPVDYDFLTKQLNTQRYWHIGELDRPFNERKFRALQEEILDEKRRDPVNQEDNLSRYSVESFGLRRNVPRHFQSVESPSSKKQLRGSSEHALALSDKAGLGRASRTVNEESTFETSASEPIEYSYNPSSDLSGHDLASGHSKEDIVGRSLNEETFRALQEEILAEERVSQHGNGGHLSHSNRGREDIGNRPLRYNDRTAPNSRNNFLSPNALRGSGWPQIVDVNPEEPEDIRPVDRYAVSAEDRPSALEPGLTPSSVRTEGTGGDDMDYNPMSIATEDTGWSEWSQCSHTCGHGTKTRHRTCTGPDTSTCSSGVEPHVIKCALERCTDGWEGDATDTEGGDSLSEWRDWSGWSPCSVSCGSGYNHRERACHRDWDEGEVGCHDGRQEETRTCQLHDCINGMNGGMFGRGATRRSDHHGHTKRIKCHLDESRSHLPMELFWTSPSGEKITHAMAHERNSKYRIEGTTLVVTEDHPTEGSYHCNVVYGGSSGSHNKGKTGSTAGGCHSHPCHHKGICLDQSGHNVSYRCMCPAGYEGMTCHMAPYLEGDVIVLSLLGWFVVSSSVAIIIFCFCCSKQIKKKKMKQKLELDDAPAEKLLAKILPHIDTLHNTDSDEDEDTKLLLGFRPPKANVAGKPQMQNIRPKEAKEKPKKTGMFKAFVQKVAKTTGKEIKVVAIPTPQKWKTLTNELKTQRNRNNSNTLDSSISEVDSLISNTALNSSDESLSEGGSIDGYSQSVNHNMNNCSWDYSNVSSCPPCDLNSSSIVGNGDDSCLEISTDDFRDFQVANAFSVFKGSPSTPGKQAVIDPSLVHENSSSIPTTFLSWPGKMPQGTGTHPMFHFEPTEHTSISTSNSFPERQNNVGVSCGLASGTNPWRRDRPWAISTPPRRGNGVRVRLPPSPSLSVSPSRLKLPPSPTRQRAPGVFGPAEEHVILEKYRGRRTTRPKHAKYRVTFDTNPQETFDAHSPTGAGECNTNGTRRTSASPSIRSVHDNSGSSRTCYRDNNTSTSSGSWERQGACESSVRLAD